MSSYPNSTPLNYAPHQSVGVPPPADFRQHLPWGHPHPHPPVYFPPNPSQSLGAAYCLAALTSSYADENNEATRSYFHEQQQQQQQRVGKFESDEKENLSSAAAAAEEQQNRAEKQQQQRCFGTPLNNIGTDSVQQLCGIGAKEFSSEQERLRYMQRRSRNNEAAKLSRSKRREREKMLEERVKVLEEENRRLRDQLAVQQRGGGNGEWS